MALVGPNGSGKTTLVKQINGLLRPQTGRVLVSGRPPASYSVREISEVIGFVHQNPDRMIFAERVFDEAAFGLVVRNAGREAIERKVSEVLSVVGLEHKAQEDPFLLTKGERQRLAVAATLAVGPQVLILDEPTTGLDYGEIVDMMNLLTSLNERGHTVICITHNMDVAARLLPPDGRPGVGVDYRRRVGEGSLLAAGRPRPGHDRASRRRPIGVGLRLYHPYGG